MALVSDGFELSVGLIDNGRKVINKVYELNAADNAEAVTAAGAILTALNAITDLAITGYRINEVYIEDALTIPTVLSAQAENIARLSIQLATSPLKKATHDVPGPIDGIFVGAVGTANYDVVNTAATLLTNYTSLFKASGSAFLSDGENAALTNEIIRGARVHRGTSLNNPG
jgi:hypothetical protein